MLRLRHTKHYYSDPDNTSHNRPTLHSNQYLDTVLCIALQDIVLTSALHILAL